MFNNNWIEREFDQMKPRYGLAGLAIACTRHASTEYFWVFWHLDTLSFVKMTFQRAFLSIKPGSPETFGHRVDVVLFSTISLRCSFTNLYTRFWCDYNTRGITRRHDITPPKEESPLCDCGETQTVRQIVESCPSWKHAGWVFWIHLRGSATTERLIKLDVQL